MWDRSRPAHRAGTGSVPPVLWAKVLVPVVLATTGVGAGVAAAVLPDDAPAASGPARAWVDSPGPDATFGPGTIPVDAHAADPTSAIAALELLVDGEAVATDEDLDRTEDLVVATFDWDAAVGVHELVVREVGDGATSAPRTIVVQEGMAPAPSRPDGDEEVAAGPTTGDEGASTSSTDPTDPDGSTSSTGPEDTTTSTAASEPPGSAGATTTTAPPSGPTTAPPGTQPAAPPTIQRATLFPSPAVLYTAGCSYTVEVAVSATGAEAVSVSVEGTSFFRQMARSGDAWTLTLTGGSQWNGAAGDHAVTVVAGNGDSTVTATAGTLTVDDRPGCPKD